MEKFDFEKKSVTFFEIFIFYFFFKGKSYFSFEKNIFFKKSGFFTKKNMFSFSKMFFSTKKYKLRKKSDHHFDVEFCQLSNAPKQSFWECLRKKRQDNNRMAKKIRRYYH